MQVVASGIERIDSQVIAKCDAGEFDEEGDFMLLEGEAATQVILERAASRHTSPTMPISRALRLMALPITRNAPSKYWCKSVYRNFQRRPHLEALSLISNGGRRR